MFLSTFEKQLDAKRRIVVPQEFRALVSGPFDGVFCFPSIEADCLEGGGKALFIGTYLPGDGLHLDVKRELIRRQRGRVNLSATELSRTSMTPLLDRVAAAGEFHVEALGEQGLQAIEQRLGSLALAVCQQPRDPAFAGAGERDQRCGHRDTSVMMGRKPGPGARFLRASSAPPGTRGKTPGTRDHGSCALAPECAKCTRITPTRAMPITTAAICATGARQTIVAAASSAMVAPVDQP